MVLGRVTAEHRLSCRTMRDADGPSIAGSFYSKLFEKENISNDDIARALDYAVRDLRDRGVPLEGWATFMHIGA
jgi:hypothetical protein